jgi:molybdopterin converting factor small subunit
MRVSVSSGGELLVVDFPGTAAPTVESVLDSLKRSRPEIHASWCDESGRLRQSLAVLVNGEHIRYRQGLATVLNEGDEVYVIPLVAGG